MDALDQTCETGAAVEAELTTDEVTALRSRIGADAPHKQSAKPHKGVVLCSIL